MEEKLYLLSHLALFTGLTDRTLRNYLACGILQGEKINGIWHFSPEQVDAFIRNPAVKPSIQAKINALVYDFLLENKKETIQTCIILDLPGCDPKTVCEFFCSEISNGDYKNIRFSFDTLSDTPRVIVKGDAAMVNRLMAKYNQI